MAVCGCELPGDNGPDWPKSVLCCKSTSGGLSAGCERVHECECACECGHSIGGVAAAMRRRSSFRCGPQKSQRRQWHQSQWNGAIAAAHQSSQSKMLTSPAAERPASHNARSAPDATAAERSIIHLEVTPGAAYYVSREANDMTTLTQKTRHIANISLAFRISQCSLPIGWVCALAVAARPGRSRRRSTEQSCARACSHHASPAPAHHISYSGAHRDANLGT
eukprot:6193093-Pleurochrysis_carterae.AAC.3